MMQAVEPETAAYFAFAQGVAAAVAAGDEDALDENLCELDVLSKRGKSRACRDRAAHLVSLHRYWGRLEEREAARLDAARDGLAIALATGDTAKVNASLEALETLAGEAADPANRTAARRIINRHFKGFGTPVPSRA